MLEVAILDNTEQILQKLQPTAMPSISPVAYQINGLVTGLVYAGDSTIASSLAQSLAKGMSAPSYPSPDYSKMWLGAYSGQMPANKTILFDVGAETVEFDDTGSRGMVQIITDNIGTVWAQSTVNNGLWKRTAPGTWAQMLSDSGLATGVRYRASDTTYWYQSVAGNHYQIANGTASLQSAPTGTLVQVPSSGSDWLSPDAPYLSSFAAFGTDSTFKNADGSTLAVPPDVPMDVFLNWGVSSSAPGPFYQVHLDASYSLLISHAQTSGVYTYYWLYLYNKTTGVIRYIGCIPPVAVKNTVTPTAAHLRPFAAKWAGNGFRLYLRGSVAVATNDATAGNKGGIVKVDVPYQPNF